MKKLKCIILFLILFLNIINLNAEWKIQKVFKDNDSVQIRNKCALFDEVTSSIYCSQDSYLVQNAIGTSTYNLIKININDLSKQQYILKQKENKVVVAVIDKFEIYGIPDNRLSTFRKINNNIIFLNTNGLSIFDLGTSELKSKKIIDEFDNKTIYGFNGIQKVRDYYGKLLVYHDTVYFTSKANIIDKAEISQYIPTAHLAGSSSEIWKYNNDKFELIFLDSMISPEIKPRFSPDFNEIAKVYKDEFLLGATRFYASNDKISLYKLSRDNKIKAFQEFDSVEVMKESVCKNIYSKNNKIYAKYSRSSLGNDWYPDITSRILVYENEVPLTSFPLFKGLDAYDSDRENAQWSRGFIEYKDFVFYVARENIYIIKNNKLSVLNIEKGMNDSLSDGHGQVIINDRGIYIFTVNGNILYNTNIDELISASGIDNGIDTKEYFNVLNNNINFIQQADSYTISDIQSRVYLNKANPNSVEALPDLTNGTYFILAQFGENYISNKILITK